MVNDSKTYEELLKEFENLKQDIEFLKTLNEQEIKLRKQAEKEYKSCEQKYQTILHTIMDGYLLADCNGNLIDVNETYCRMSGYSREELLLMRIHDLVSADNMEIISKQMKMLTVSGKTHFESVHCCKNGNEFNVEINAQYLPINDGQFIVFLQDISQRKKLEDTQLFLLKCGQLGSENGFFESLAKHLSKVLDMDYVCIDKLVGDGLTAQTVAVFNDGNFDPNCTYTLKDTPCGDVVGKTICCFPKNVSKLFPKDQALQELNADSYVGTTLWSNDGQPIGLIAIIGRKSLSNPELAASILKLVAIRAAGELERLKYEEELQESEERYRKAQQIGHVGSWEYNIKDDTFWGSDEGKRIYGFNLKSDIFTAEEVTNCIIEKERVNQTLVDLIEKNKPYNIEFEIRPINSSETKTIHSIAELLRDENGNPIKVTGVLHDITDRKLAEGALRKSEEQFKHLVWDMQVGVLLQGPNSEIIMSNPKALELLGLTEDQLLGKTSFDPDWNVIHENGSPFPGNTHPVPQAIALGRPVQNVIMGVYRPNSKDRVWLLVDAIPRINPDGTVLHVICTFIDISKRKHAELIIKQQNTKLHEINATKDKFLSIIAHDLKSPFQGFLGMTQILAEETNSFTLDELSTITKDMHNSAANLYKLLENLLTWAQLQKGTIKFNPTELDLSVLVAHNVEIINDRAIQKGINIINEISGNWIAFADEKMIDSILRNLLSNAIKFTSRNGKIVLKAQKDVKLFIQISISDTGVGLSEGDCGKLFKIEEKVRRSGTEGEASTGLGLLLCKEFVNKNGGEIWVESQEDIGSTFYFTVPITPSSN